jgi:hypothetical protein
MVALPSGERVRKDLGSGVFGVLAVAEPTQAVAIDGIRGCGGGERPECARGYAPIRFTISPSASRQVIGFQAGSKIR